MSRAAPWLLLVWLLLIPCAAAADATYSDPAGDVIVQATWDSPAAGSPGAAVPYVDILSLSVAGTNVTVGLGCLNMFVNASGYETISRDAIYRIYGSNATHAVEVGVWARGFDYYAWVDATNATSGLVESRVVAAVRGFADTTNFTVVVGQDLAVEKMVAYTNSSANATSPYAVDFYGFAPAPAAGWLAQYWWVLLLAGLCAGIGVALYFGLRKPRPAGRAVVKLTGL